VVHRLDLDTSGVLIFAKSAPANRALAELFRRHDVLREYLAVVAGHLPDEITRIARPVHGRRAATRVEVVRRLGDEATLVRLCLETGRTHQVRIHLSEVGHPVLGDRHRRAPSRLRPPRLALHAARLALRHPTRGDPLELVSPWPSDLATWLAGVDLVVS
jgi:23S rRNA pseudouridine1911/1915/1917 synthase